MEKRTKLSSRGFKQLPETILIILVGVMLLVALIPEIRTSVINATHITGAAATILGYIGVALIGGFTFVLIRVMLGGGGRTRVVKLSMLFKGMQGNIKGELTIIAAILIGVGFAFAVLIGIPFLDEIASQIADATATGQPLNGTLEGTILGMYPLILVGAIVLSAFIGFMTSPKGRAYRQSRRR